MAEKTITVRELSRPTVTLQLLQNFRDESATSAAVNITGYAFKLIVKRDLDDADARAYFDLAGTIVAAASGTVKFDLTLEHTALPAGTYPAEVRWWADGDTTKPPSDAFSVDYVVERAVDSVV